MGAKDTLTVPVDTGRDGNATCRKRPPVVTELFGDTSTVRRIRTGLSCLAARMPGGLGGVVNEAGPTSGLFLSEQLPEDPPEHSPDEAPLDALRSPPLLDGVH